MNIDYERELALISISRAQRSLSLVSALTQNISLEVPMPDNPWHYSCALRDEAKRAPDRCAEYRGVVYRDGGSNDGFWYDGRKLSWDTAEKTLRRLHDGALV